MERTLYRSPDGTLEWIDVVNPTAAELDEIASRHSLHRMSVEDCLDPWHLPKYERFDDTTFVILRAFDPTASDAASTVQDLTRKIAIFVRPRMVLTVHRVEMEAITGARERFAADLEPSPGLLLGALVNGTLDSYNAPLEHAEEQLDRFETALFSSRRRAPPILDLYAIKRRVTLLKRLIWQTTAVIQRLIPPSERSGPVFQDMRDSADSYQFYVDQLLDGINNLLGIHVSLASHRTNEVMRVLTVFSAFFLPLTFVVGVYGMNFRYMPELTRRWGYPAVLTLMAGISLGIAVWFRRRGWLGRPED